MRARMKRVLVPSAYSLSDRFVDLNLKNLCFLPAGAAAAPKKSMTVHENEIDTEEKCFKNCKHDPRDQLTRNEPVH